MENIGLYFLALIIPLIAQMYVTSNYNKYKKINSKSGLSGFEVARKILDKNGLNDMYIVETNGTMSDHYDSSRKTIKLSSEVFHGDSIASISIAAHECGHAIQDKEGYAFMRIRSLIFPIVKFGTQIAYVVLLIGLLANMLNIIWTGILLVSLGLLFQLITLPVEFDASRKALNELENTIRIKNEEIDSSNIMLKAAALTYVAGVVSSVLELLRLILIFTNNNRD